MYAMLSIIVHGCKALDETGAEIDSLYREQFHV